MENFLEIKEKLILENKTPLSFNSKDGLSLNLDWITNCGASEVLKIRNAEHVLANLDKGKISEEDHLKFISKYNKANRLDFIIKSNLENEYVGGVNLVKSNLGWEIGKYIGNKNYERRGIAKRATESMINFIAKEFKYISKIYAKTKIKNITNIKINEIIGFKTIRILDENFLLMQKFL